MLGTYFTYIMATALLIDPTYKAIIEPILGAEPLIQIAVTVGLLMILRNIALAIFHAEPRGVPFTFFNVPLRIDPITIVLLES